MSLYFELAENTTNVDVSNLDSEEKCNENYFELLKFFSSIKKLEITNIVDNECYREHFFSLKNDLKNSFIIITASKKDFSFKKNNIKRFFSFRKNEEDVFKSFSLAIYKENYSELYNNSHLNSHILKNVLFSIKDLEKKEEVIF